jgi:catechol 2,3-dioxygenase-like lactoylglutathione lyase family enzyme
MQFRKIGQEPDHNLGHSRGMNTFVLAASLAGTVLAQSPVPKLKASMVVLGVADLSRSVRFYRETLDLLPAPAPGDLPMFRAGELTIVLNDTLSGGAGGFELVFPVESVAAVRKQLGDRGCKFTGDSREVAPGMWAATFTDPDGHRLTLFGGR